MELIYKTFVRKNIFLIFFYFEYSLYTAPPSTPPARKKRLHLVTNKNKFERETIMHKFLGEVKSMSRKKEIIYPEYYHEDCPFSVVDYDNGYGRKATGRAPCLPLCALYDYEKRECSIYLAMEKYTAKG